MLTEDSRWLKLCLNDADDAIVLMVFGDIEHDDMEYKSTSDADFALRFLAGLVSADELAPHECEEA